MANKIIFNPKAMLKRVTPFKGIINQSTVLPILETLLVQVKPQKITFSATDLESIMVISMDVETPAGADFIFCVDYANFIKFLIHCEEAPTTFEFKPKEMELVIVQDTAKVILMVEDANNYPKPVEIKDKWKMEIAAIELLPVIKQSIPFCSHDDLRPAMTGLYLHEKEGKLRVVTTDAHRMYHKYALDKNPATMKDYAQILPAKAMRALTNWFTGETIKFKADDNHACFYSDNFELYTRCIDAKYPDYTAVLVDPETVFYMKRKQFMTILKLGTAYSNKSTNQVEFFVQGGSVNASSADVDFSMSFSYKAPIYNASHVGIDFKFAANGKFIIEALALGKDEYVKIATFESSTKAFVIDDCLLCMPLMLNQ